MSLKPGARIAARTSACEVLVVRPPATDEPLTCAGAPMDQSAGSAAVGAGPTDIQIGKRYVDETSGLEVLCVKAGQGPLRIGNRDLVLRAPRTLPASD